MPSWRGLRARLLVAHLLVIVIGTAALSVTAWVAAPRILDFRVAMMAEHRVPMPMSALPGSTFDAALVDVFRQSLNQALLIGALAALAAALVATVVVTRQVAGPVQRLAVAARRLATGRYADRVPTSGTTELDDLTSSFNYMAAALESSEARRLQLIGDVAHELRTPISTLEAYLDGLADGIVQPSGDVWALLRAEGDRVRKLVEDLHELWQAEGKQLPLEIGAIPPVSLVEPTAARFGPDLAAKGLTLAVSAPENLPPVRADRDRALQVLANLLGNALRYTPAPGEVEISVVPEGTEVRFSIRDTGIGIAAEHLPHLFERFYRVEKSRSRALGGSGVGLAIAKALVEAMGGRIRATSPGPGGGATFSFTLPIA